MSTSARIVALAALAFALLTPGAFAQGHVPGQLIVTFEDGVGHSQRAAAHARVGGRVTARIDQIDTDVVVVGVGRESAALRAYDNDRRVSQAERDVVVTALDDDCATGSAVCFVPSDPSYGLEWGLQSDSFTTHPDATFAHDADIDAPWAWQHTHGSAATQIAILDSGIDQDHEDLSAKIVANRNFTKSKSVDDKYGHGTHVAGTAAAITNNDIGVAGVGFDATLMNVKVLSDNGMGSCSGIANGITWAADNGAEVINMSLGGGACAAEERAVDYAWGKGVLLTAAAGNSGAETISCPACYANTIAVAATDSSDTKADFSNYGPGVDVAAPGQDVYSTFPNHRNRIGKIHYGYGSGTSMAAPHVAGAAGLLWATVTDTGEAGRNDDVRARIEAYADPIAGTGTLWSDGRLNVCRALTETASDCDG